MKKLVIGTRKSQLAVAQTQLAIDAIKANMDAIECEICAIHTTGDRILDKPLVSFGGKGIFIEEFEQKLQNGEIDIAVHSAKDMPTVLGKGLEVAATLPREDPRDVLLWRKGEELSDKKTLVIGTGSKRRGLQIQALYPCECKLLRGNVNTRLSKLEQGEYDAILLAAAGLKRLGALTDDRFQFRFLEIEEMVPSGGQGIIALEALAGTEAYALAQKISDRDAYCQLLIERYILEKMNAGCHEPIGVYSEIQNGCLAVYLMDGRGRAIKRFHKEFTYPLESYGETMSETENRWNKLLQPVYGEIKDWLEETGCIEKGI